MLVASRTRTILFATFASSIFLAGCGSENKAAAPPRAGTLAFSWYSANETWKSGDYEKTAEQLSRLAVAQSEYREKSRQWLIVAAAGVADGYRELADAYETGARTNREVALEYRTQANKARNASNRLALIYAETINETLNAEKDLKLSFDVPFPSGTLSEPIQLSRVSKGLKVQPADHDELLKSMAARGVVRFAAALATENQDMEKAKTAFANPPKELALAAVAKSLLDLADIYGNRQLDMPKRGNALCVEAQEILALLPPASKQRKDLEIRLKEQLKRFKIAS